MVPDYQIIGYDANGLAERDPFEIGEIGILSHLDVVGYYGSVVNSMVHTTFINQIDFNRANLGVVSDYYFGDDKIPGAKLITGSRKSHGLDVGMNRVLIAPSKRLLIRSVSDLVDSFSRIETADDFEEGDFGDDWSIDIRTDIIDYQFSGNGNYFRFNFHHPDEERVVPKRLL